jgi:phage portal protein BeeE
MNRLQQLVRGSRRDAGLSFSDYLGLLQAQWTFNGNVYPTFTYPSNDGKNETIPNDFRGYVDGIYKANGPVWSCIAARIRLFSEARFQFQQLRNGRPGDLFGDPSLELLERPWENGTTGDLLARMEQDASLAGNFYGAKRGRSIRRLRPDWVTIVLGSYNDPDITGYDIDAEVIGYIYSPTYPNGQRGNEIVLLPTEICHYAPTPDPTANFRGMSWLTPVCREVQGDNAATSHKNMYFQNAATSNMVVKLDKEVRTEDFDAFVEKMDAQHKGLVNAYKTLYLGGGADVTVVGSNMQQMDFKAIQGAGETRIAAAAEVPPIIAGFSEGLSSATYSNYGQAKRKFGDSWARPAWRSAAAALETLVPPPPGARLWYDDRDIPYLAEDKKDSAEIQGKKAETIRVLVDAGFEADAVVAAVMADDLNLLQHTGLFSVQLQPPGMTAPAAADTASESKSVTLVLPPTEVAVNVPPTELHADIHVPAQDLHVEVNQPVPNITVEPALVTVDNHVESAPARVVVMPPDKTRKRIVYDENGRIERLEDA